jgi:hypothetical protein
MWKRANPWSLAYLFALLGAEVAVGVHRAAGIFLVAIAWLFVVCALRARAPQS